LPVRLCGRNSRPHSLFRLSDTRSYLFAQAINPVCTGVRCRLHGTKLRMRGGQTPCAQGSDTVCTGNKPRMHRGQIPFAWQKAMYAHGSDPVCTGVNCRLQGKNLHMYGGQTPYAQGSDAVCKAKISVCTGAKPRMHGKKQAAFVMQTHIVHHAYGNFPCEYANFFACMRRRPPVQSHISGFACGQIHRANRSLSPCLQHISTRTRGNLLCKRPKIA